MGKLSLFRSNLRTLGALSATLGILLCFSPQAQGHGDRSDRSDRGDNSRGNYKKAKKRDSNSKSGKDKGGSSCENKKSSNPKPQNQNAGNSGQPQNQGSGQSNGNQAGNGNNASNGGSQSGAGGSGQSKSHPDLPKVASAKIGGDPASLASIHFDTSLDSGVSEKKAFSEEEILAATTNPGEPTANVDPANLMEEAQAIPAAPASSAQVAITGGSSTGTAPTLANNLPLGSPAAQNVSLAAEAKLSGAAEEGEASLAAQSPAGKISGSSSLREAIRSRLKGNTQDGSTLAEYVRKTAMQSAKGDFKELEPLSSKDAFAFDAGESLQIIRGLSSEMEQSEKDPQFLRAESLFIRVKEAHQRKLSPKPSPKKSA